jgi:hypothetical protein
VHHCPGRDGWVGDASPGNCQKHGNHCGKHQTICKCGCGNWHLKSQAGCATYIGRLEAEERRERAERQRIREEEAKAKEDAFFNPPKKRKKPKKTEGIGDDRKTEGSGEDMENA